MPQLFNKSTCLSLANILIAWCVSVFTCSADIYMYQDSNGVLHLGNGVEARQKGSFLLKESPRYHFSGSKDVKKIQELIETTAVKHSVDPDLAKAIAKAESAFNPNAVSPKGAIGVMQLMPGTASRFKVNDIYHPSDNIEGGIKYLKTLLKLFPKNKKLAIAAYNAGENRVISSGYKIPNIKETQEYVDRVVRYYNYYRKKGGKTQNTDLLTRPLRKKIAKDGTVIISNL